MEIRLTVQHYLNSGHLYCRLRDFKVPKPIAKFMASLAKSTIDPILYYRRKTDECIRKTN